MKLRALAHSPGAAVTVIALVAYAYFYQAGGWNQNSRFALVRALVEDGTARVDGAQRASWDLSCKAPDGPCLDRKRPDPARGEHFYCDKAPGAQLLAVPAYALVHAVAGSENASPRYQQVASYLVTVWAVALPSALGVLFLYLLLAGFGLGAGRRALVALAWGLGTLAWPYATLYYGHQLAAALLCIGFAMLVRQHRLERPLSRAGLVACGAVLGLAVSVEYPAALAGAAIGAYALATVRPWPRIGWLALGVAVPAAVTAGYHWIVFGGPLALPYDFSVQDNRAAGWFMGMGVPRAEALRGLLISGYRGLFYSAPWLLLAAPGAVVLWRRRYRAEVAVCAAVVLLFLALNGSLVDWNGGWTFGARYLVPAVPFLAVLAAGVLLAEPARIWRWVWGGGALAAALSVYLMLVATAVKPEVPDVYVEPPRTVVKIERPFGQYLVPSFWRGELAVNTQGIHQAGARRHGKAFVGKRWAFNGGTALGLSGLASLLPLLVLLGAAGWWLRRAVASGGGASSCPDSPSRT